MTVRRSTGTVFDWQGPSLYMLDKKMKLMASGVRAGQLSRERARQTLEEKAQVFVYSKAK